jgi:streptogramin lyase
VKRFLWERPGDIAIAPDGTIWAAEDDGVVRLSRDGAVAKILRPHELAGDLATGEIGIGPDGSVWTNGTRRMLRFTPRGVQSYRLAPLGPVRAAFADVLRGSKGCVYEAASHPRSAANPVPTVSCQDA